MLRYIAKNGEKGGGYVALYKSGKLFDRFAKRWGGNKQSFIEFGYDRQVSFICIVINAEGAHCHLRD